MNKTFLFTSLLIVMISISSKAQYELKQMGDKLVGTGAEGRTEQGKSVSLSADGNTAIVGGETDYGYTGAAWVYTRSGGIWTQEGNKLVGAGADGQAWQGESVSISADGNTAIVGGGSDNNGKGAVWMFTRTAGIWTQQGEKLVGTGIIDRAVHGRSVSLSADGNTALVGGSFDNSFTGAAWVYTRTAGVWSQQGNKLVGTGAIGTASQGSSVSLSADGNTAIVAGEYDDNGTGAVWVYTRTSGVWTQQGNKLVAAGTMGIYQGRSTSLSADGNTAIVGSSNATNNVGAVWVYTRTAGVWSQQGNKLVGTGAEGSSYQGSSVSLSDDGNTAMVGASYDSTGTGAVWVFTRSGGTWSQQGSKLIGEGAVGGARQGTSVSLSGDGSTAIVGGYSDDRNEGAVWAFTRSEGVWVQEGNKLVGTGTLGKSSQGKFVTLSADGNTALVGADYDDFHVGAVWVYIRLADGSWIQQGNKIVGEVSAVSLSADGNTAIIGAQFDNGTIGAVRIYTRTAGIWTQQGNKLVGTGAIGNAKQGESVSLSADGNTAIVGGSSDNNIGAAWVFTRSGGVWTQQGDKLVGTGAVGVSNQGSSVSISADGNTAIVAGDIDDNYAGAVWVYTRSGGVWTQQGDKLTPTGAVGGSHVGSSVSISGDGNTAIFGGSPDGVTSGGSWIFTRSAGVWTQQGKVLIGSGAVGNADQGHSVSLSSDGNIALASGFLDNENTGAVWVFTRSAGVWSQQGDKFIGTGGVGSSDQGCSISLSADGLTAVVGGYADNLSEGAVWMFGLKYMPTVTTATVSAITKISATSGGDISSDGGAAVTASGLVFSATNNLPTLSNSVTNNGVDSGGFVSNITGLADGAEYFVRAYATNSVGTSYGNVEIFSTASTLVLPTVTTTTVSVTSQTSATGGGDISNDGGATITASGIVFSAINNPPTLSDSVTSNGTDSGAFISDMAGLAIGTEYYVRAYATNSVGTSYGDVETFSIVTSIESNNSVSSNIVIYPNPTNSIFSISGVDNKGFISVEISDLVGNVLVRTNTLTNIDLRNLQSGVYIYKVIGDKTYTGKVIKE